MKDRFSYDSVGVAAMFAEPLRHIFSAFAGGENRIKLVRVNVWVFRGQDDVDSGFHGPGGERIKYSLPLPGLKGGQTVTAGRVNRQGKSE